MRYLPPTRPVQALFAALLVVVCAAAGPSGAGSPHPSRQRDRGTDSRRVAIIGVDGADWRVIDRLVGTGRLPAFARLKKIAACGVLKAEPPLLSPIIWTTVATGRLPEDHGVLDFMVDVPGGGQVPIHGGARRTKALWEIWSEAHRSVLVAGWWATWPADKVRGVLVSDRLTSSRVRSGERPDRGLVHPAEVWPAVAREVVEPAAIDFETLAELLPLTRAEFGAAVDAERGQTSRLYRNPIAHFRAAVAAGRTWRRVGTSQLRAATPDLFAIYFDLVDTASHLFVRDRARGERAIASAYVETDAALAQLARLLDPDTLLLVLSDHGFYPADAGIRDDPADLTSGATAWHRPYGIFAATTAGGLAGVSSPPAASWVGTVTPLDIVPTLLAHGGLPLAADMPGRVIPGVGALAVSGRIASYGEHVLPETPVAAGGPGDKALLERLRALGYVSGQGATTSLARVNLGEILYRRGDLRGATRELEAVVRQDPSHERASLWLARTYAAAGRTDDALRLYDRVIRARPAADPPDPIVFLAATELEIGQGRAVSARERLDKAPESLQTTPEVLTARGIVEEALGDTRSAERRYRAAYDAAPSDITALQRLVNLQIAVGRGESARMLAARTAQAYPSSPSHLALAGDTTLALKRFDEAERWFLAALALAPDAESVKVELARARLLGGRPADALEALSGTSPSRAVETVRGAALSETGDWPAAIASFERALTAGAPTVELLNALGHAQLRAGRSREAAQTLERSLSLAPDQPAIRSLLDTARKR